LQQRNTMIVVRNKSRLKVVCANHEEVKQKRSVNSGAQGAESRDDPPAGSPASLAADASGQHGVPAGLAEAQGEPRTDAAAQAAVLNEVALAATEAGDPGDADPATQLCDMLISFRACTGSDGFKGTGCWRMTSSDLEHICTNAGVKRNLRVRGLPRKAVVAIHSTGNSAGA
jgi:hypothetical protein